MIFFVCHLLTQRAVRDAIKGIVESKQINVSKEQIDIFCLRVLATCSMSISSASSRTAALMAFGKYSLVSFYCVMIIALA